MEYQMYCQCPSLHKCFNSEVVIKVTDPPSYISDLKISNRKDLIIFIYKKDGSGAAYPKEVGGVKDITFEDSVADLSVTGQPLESPFENEIEDYYNDTILVEPVVLPEDHYYAPVTLMEARRCLSFISLHKNPPLPVWILTNAVDEKRTFLMGVDITNDGSESKYNTTMWTLAHSMQTEKIPIKNMIDSFEKTFKVAEGYKRSSAVSCVFNIKDNPGMAKNSKCFLEVNWQQPSYEVPISQADTYLIIECNVGQEECQMSRWWQQLSLIHSYLEIIKQRKQSGQHTNQLPSFKSDWEGKPPLTTRVQELIRVSDNMSVCRQLTMLQETSAFNATIQHLLKDNLQKGQDVTDRLWSLLIEAETYEELTECFQLVIREVRKNAVKPYIFSKNKTRFAYLLHNIKTSCDLELLEPLKLLVEMGLEKLKRDYIFIFMSSQLARVESLSVPKLLSFSEVASGDWQATVETQMQWLAQIHTVLELLSVIHSSLSPPTLMQVTSQALTTFVQPNGSPVLNLLHLINNRTYQLRAPILTTEVRNFIEGDRLFYKWMLKLSADSKWMGFTSTFVFFEDCPFPRQITNQLQDVLNDTDNLTQSLQASGLHCDSKVQEKYSYVQLCSAYNKIP